MPSQDANSMWGAIGRMLGNIHGTDAALLADVGLIYIMSTSKNPGTLTMLAMDYAFYLGIAIMTGRVLLAAINAFNRKR